MADDLLSSTGPEGRNQDAAVFEEQLVAMGRDLGWHPVFRNIDFYLESKGQGPARGIDVLWAVRNARDGKQYGWVQEAKRHDGMGRYSVEAVRQEVQTLAGKVSRLQSLERFRKHREISRRRLELVGGILTHKTPGFQPETMAARLQNLQLVGKQGGIRPVRVLFYGPDTLNSLAEGFDRHGKPASFYWPPSLAANGAWGDACPPEQLAAGMLAWRSGDGKTVLWLRQDLHHDDLDALAEIAFHWDIDPDHVLFSYLTPEQMRLIGQSWQELAQETGDRKVGRLPDRPEALDITLERTNRFDKVWAAA